MKVTVDSYSVGSLSRIISTCSLWERVTNGRWSISDESIRYGLEHTYLLGRIQFLTSEEAEVLELTGATVLLDGAHTKDSAQDLMNTIRMAFPEAQLVFVVAMASDKDHVGFA
ncbi:hypothetical protein JHK85_035941 [Glycine max]|nr:hypothetical protein JHK85_035941 [Glycine max]